MFLCVYNINYQPDGTVNFFNAAQRSQLYIDTGSVYNPSSSSQRFTMHKAPAFQHTQLLQNLLNLGNVVSLPCCNEIQEWWLLVWLSCKKTTTLRPRWC